MKAVVKVHFLIHTKNQGIGAGAGAGAAGAEGFQLEPEPEPHFLPSAPAPADL